MEDLRRSVTSVVSSSLFWIHLDDNKNDDVIKLLSGMSFALRRRPTALRLYMCQVTRLHHLLQWSMAGIFVASGGAIGIVIVDEKIRQQKIRRSSIYHRCSPSSVVVRPFDDFDFWSKMKMCHTKCVKLKNFRQFPRCLGPIDEVSRSKK